MSLQPRAEESFDSFLERFKAWSRNHYESIKKYKQVEKDEPDGSSFNSVPCTFGTEHPNSHINMNDGRSWDEYFSGFKKWSEDYYRSLQMQNQVPERSSQDMPVDDSSGTKRLEIPLQTNGFVGQPEVQVREELFRQPVDSFPQNSFVYCFPNMTNSSSRNMYNVFLPQQPRYYAMMNPQYFNELPPRMNYTVSQMDGPLFWK
ncbi:hypothetical protein TNCV_191081 [Trichonephila clavipes]|nr:hypothetical protein TNCV_191081 [Trichonephila clavipes]